VKEKDPELKRSHKKYLSFNSREMRVLEGFCNKYQINNKSKFMRESIITAVLKQLEEDAPTLFDETKPNLFLKK
jgi:hypothetical protein